MPVEIQPFLLHPHPPRLHQSLTSITLATVILGYWSFGKAFAYVGHFPVYIGEVLLIAGLLNVVRYGRVRVLNRPSFTLFWFLLMAVFFQVLLSLFGGQTFVEAIRNSATIYYGIFAWVSYSYFVRRWELSHSTPEALIRFMRAAVPWVLTGSTISMLGYIYLAGRLPVFPGTSTPVLFYKPTDAALPLVVVTFLWIHGYVKLPYGVWALLLSLVAVARSRGAMIAFVVALLISWRPNKRGIGLVSLFVGVGLLMVATDLRIGLGYREVSVQQLVANVLSLLGSERAAWFDPSTVANQNWRLEWWSRIWADSFLPERFLAGIGWGSNVADEYGFQTAGDAQLDVLRNPHNIFISILARGGWLAAGLWALFYGALMTDIRLALARAREPATIHMLRLCNVYIIVSLINAAFDVFLESPQNAIPHWVTIGLSWSLVHRVFQNQVMDRGG